MICHAFVRQAQAEEERRERAERSMLQPKVKPGVLTDEAGQQAAEAQS
jgi:hypothetical protein